MENIKQQITSRLESVAEGESSAIEMLGDLRNLKKYLDGTIKDVETYAFDEFDRESEGKKTFEFKGYEVTFSEGGWKYDFSNIPNHKEAKLQLKHLEDYYKMLFEGYDCIDNDTGEVYDIKRKPIKSSLKLKKI